MNDNASKVKKFPRLVGILALSLLIPYVLIYLILRFIYGLIVHIAIWVLWIPRGKSILIVTSESPVWQEYMEERIISVLQPHAIVLNWSKRSVWSRSINLQVLAFHHFAGGREFNPLAAVFRPFRRTKVFRFWHAFKEYKHGKVDQLDKITEDLLRYEKGIQDKAA